MTNAPEPPADSATYAHVDEPTSRSEPPPLIPQYIPQPPSCHGFVPLHKIVWWREQASTFCRFLRHTLSAYAPQPSDPGTITASSPSGTISKDHLPICERIYEESEERMNKIEEKSNGLLTIFSIITPLIISVIVYTSTIESLPLLWRVSVILMSITSLILVVLGFVACIRAITVKSRYSMNVHTVFDKSNNRVKDYNPDIYGRGLIWCGLMNHAMSDHIAEFVRASTFLLLLSVFILLLSVLPPLLSMGSSQSHQTISGKIQVDSPDVKDLVKNMNDVAIEVLAGVSQANSSLNDIISNIEQLLQLNQMTKKLESELKNLKDELQILNERIKKRK
jgi:hypothetical protein